MFQWVRNLKTSYKLGLGFGVCLAFTCVLGVTALSRMADVNQITEAIALHTLPNATKLAKLNSAIKQFRLSQYRYVTDVNPANKQDATTKLATFQEDAEKALAEYEHTVKTDEERKTYDTIKTSWEQYKSTSLELKPMVDRNQRVEAAAFVTTRLKDSFVAMRTMMDTKIAECEKKSAAEVKTATTIYASGRIWILLEFMGAILSGLLAAILVTRAFARPLIHLSTLGKALAVGDVDQETYLNSRDEVGQLADAFRALVAYQKEMASVAEEIAQGDLTYSIEPKSEKDALGHAFKQMSENLRLLIGALSTHSNSVADTSHQLSTLASHAGQQVGDVSMAIDEVARSASQTAVTSQEMAHGSEQQAQSAQKASVAMERLQAAAVTVQTSVQRQQQSTLLADQGMHQAAQAVEEVARSARQVTTTAQQAASVAQMGGQAVEQAIISMSRIQQQVEAASVKVRELGRKGQEIGTIVETIDQIAEQTNLLALNAAIEAARAGEHGKGFAVVADEVRKLAERATSATREIGSLISAVRAEVEEAVNAMDVSGQEVAAGAAKSTEANTALGQILQAAQSVANEVLAVTETTQAMTTHVQSVQSTVAEVRQAAQENETAVDTMTESAEQVSRVIMSIAAISQETAAGAQELSATADDVSINTKRVSEAAKEQAVSAQQISDASSELNAMAEHLQELVQQFRLEEEHPDSLRKSVSKGGHQSKKASTARRKAA